MELVYCFEFDVLHWVLQTRESRMEQRQIKQRMKMKWNKDIVGMGIWIEKNKQSQ